MRCAGKDRQIIILETWRRKKAVTKTGFIFPQRHQDHKVFKINISFPGVLCGLVGKTIFETACFSIKRDRRAEGDILPSFSYIKRNIGRSHIIVAIHYIHIDAVGSFHIGCFQSSLALINRIEQAVNRFGSFFKIATFT